MIGKVTTQFTPLLTQQSPLDEQQLRTTGQADHTVALTSTDTYDARTQQTSGGEMVRNLLLPDSGMGERPNMDVQQLIAADQLAYRDMATRMPLMEQVGPSCGTTCLSMALEYLGFPAKLELIEPYIHPYGDTDLGEVPSELARYARMMGFSAKHYSNGTLEELAGHIRAGRAITVMINYRDGMGHMVNVIGVTRDEQGAITEVKIRNPWGFDESMPAERFLNEWSDVRLTKNSAAKILPVYNRSYAVIASPDEKLPIDSPLNWLHAAPTNTLVAGLNGVGGSLTTIENGHKVAGAFQLVGNALKVVGGGVSYAIGNFIGKNVERGGEKLIESGLELMQGNAWQKIGGGFVVFFGAIIKAVGWLLSMLGGLMAGLTDLATKPFTIAGELLSKRDAVRQHIESADDDHLRQMMARSGPSAKANQLETLLTGFGKVDDADRAAALRILEHTPREQLEQVAEKFGGLEKLLKCFEGKERGDAQRILGVRETAALDLDNLVPA